MYAFHFDPARELLDIRWQGPFTPLAVADYARVLKNRFLAEGFKAGYLLRMDMTDSFVQPREVLGAFHESFYDFPKARRIAIVTPSAVARMQVRRIMTQPYLRIFETAGPALDWLLEPELV